MATPTTEIPTIRYGVDGALTIVDTVRLIQLGPECEECPECPDGSPRPTSGLIYPRMP